MTRKTDHNNWEYYEKLPDGYRRATIDDFHTNGRKKIGMEYLIKWIIRDDYYQVCIVSENLKGENLKPFIEFGRVFVKNQN
jgi:hypothetical protein